MGLVVWGTSGKELTSGLVKGRDSSLEKEHRETGTAAEVRDLETGVVARNVNLGEVTVLGGGERPGTWERDTVSQTSGEGGLSSPLGQAQVGQQVSGESPLTLVGSPLMSL